MLFLERVYRRYDEHLTFRVDDVLGRSSAIDAASAADGPPPPERHEVVVESSKPPCLAPQLRGSVEGLSWVEVIEDGRVIDSDPASSTLRAPANLLRTTITDGADFVAARAARSSLVGLRLHEPQSLWCRLSADATFGAVIAAIIGVVGADRRSPPAGQGMGTGEARGSWTTGPSARATVAIGAFLQRAAGVLGAVVLGGDRMSVIAGAGSSSLERDPCIEIARRRAGAFGQAWLVGGAAGDEELTSIGFYLRTIVSGEPDLWCFGAELELERQTTLWMFVDRRSSQGLGWACLAALTRTLADVMTGDAIV